MAAQGADAVIARIIKLAKASIVESGKKVEGVGIGSPGPLNTKTGVVLLTPNLGWTNMPLRDRVGEGLIFPPCSTTTPNCRHLRRVVARRRACAKYVIGLTLGTGSAAALSSTVRSTTA